MIKKLISIIPISLLAGGVLGYQQMKSLTPEMAIQISEQFGSTQAIVYITMLQTMILTLVASLIGFMLASRTNLDKSFRVSGTKISHALAISFIAALSIALPEKMIFADALNLPNAYEFSILYFLSSLLYGGIIEELLLRFGVMTLMVWIYQKLTRNQESKSSYIFGILMSALLFSIGHLPATFQLIGANPLAIIRGIVLNFIPGVGFGYLYWKRGIGYAIIGHMGTHMINQLILFPILF